MTRIIVDIYLPVLGLALEHHRVLRLALIADVAILDVLGALLSLDTVILRESALVAGTAGVGEEVRSNRLDGSLSSLSELADGLEVLVGSPAAGKGGKGEGHSSHGSHYVMCGFGGDGEGEKSRRFFLAVIIFFNGALNRVPPPWMDLTHWRGKSSSGRSDSYSGRVL